MYPHKIGYTEAPGQDKVQVRARWPWPYFQGHRGHFRQRHVKDGFHSISEEMFDIPSPNLVPRSTRARQKPSLNWVTLTVFSRLQRSFKTTAYKRWFPFNIRRNIKLSSPNLFHKSMVSAQYPKYLTYPRQIWYPEAPGQSGYQDWTSVPWTYFQGHEGHLSLVKMAFA